MLGEVQQTDSPAERPAAAADPGDSTLIRTALWLVGGLLAYNVVEGVIALWAGASAESIALFGFGLDSVIECSAASLMLWRLTVEARGADEDEILRTEHRVHRFIGATFLALAVYVLVQASLMLWLQQPPEETLVGVALTTASVLIMPLLAWKKLQVADRMGSASLRAEAKETLACVYLSVTVLIGLAANALLGWWWADPLAALLIIPWLVREGLEGWRGEDE